MMYDIDTSTAFISPEKLFCYSEAFLRTLLVRWSVRTEHSWYGCLFTGIPIFRMEVMGGVT